jgi:hypothetical protein
VQFRSTKDSPTFNGRTWKYIGLKGHNRPSLINSHLVNPIFTVMLIGTFDALLGEQDGLPTTSPNGVSVFLKHEHAVRFVGLMGRPKHRIVVPDTTSSELLATYRMADMIDYRVAFLPFDIAAKDYTEYRLAGGTKESFMGDVLGIESPFLTDAKADQVRNVLAQMAQGNTYEAITCLHRLYEAPTNPVIVNHTMQLFIHQAARYFPMPDFYKGFTAGFTADQWALIIDQLEGAFEGKNFEMLALYQQILRIVTQWSEFAYRKQGGF